MGILDSDCRFRAFGAFGAWVSSVRATVCPSVCLHDSSPTGAYREAVMLQNFVLQETQRVEVDMVPLSRSTAHLNQYWGLGFRVFFKPHKKVYLGLFGEPLDIAFLQRSLLLLTRTRLSLVGRLI